MDYITIDSIIFIVSNLLLGIYAFTNKQLKLKEKIAYTIFFMILNSSFNIMIKSVHEYNTVIPRTYIYRQKFVSYFSLLDIICVLFIIFNIKSLSNIVNSNKLVFVHILRAMGLYFLGTISFLFMQGYWMDGGNNFLTTSKGWVYSIATLIFTFKYMNKNLNLIYPFAIILINGMITTFLIPINEIWVRYGNRAIIIDQEDATTISNCIIIFLLIKCTYIKEDNLKSKIINWVMLIIFLAQNIYCVYKSNLILLPLMLIVYLLLTNGQNKLFIILTMLGIPSALLCFWNKFYSLMTSLAINTRQTQIVDYLNYIQQKGIYPLVFGSGISTPYYSISDTGDTGERKTVDLKDNYSSYWRTGIQTPILSIYKTTGLVGILYFMITSIYLILITIDMIKKACKKNRKDYLIVETLTMGILLLVQTMYEVFIYGGTIPYCIFYTFCLAKFAINCTKIKKEEDIK